MRTPLEIAQELAGWGFVVLPAKNKGKAPIVPWQEWQKTKPGDEKLAEWFGGSELRNFWLLCGAVTALAVVDIDNEAGEKWLRETVDAEILDRTVCVRTRKGWHYYFALEPDEVVASWALHEKKGPAVDFRAEGSGVICPPSIHESAGAYTWKRSPKECSLQKLPDVLRQARGATAGKDGTRKTPRTTLVELLAAPVMEGERNIKLASACGHLARDIEDRTAYMLAVEALVSKSLAGLPEKEWRKTAASIWNAKQRTLDAGNPSEEDYRTIPTPVRSDLDAATRIGYRPLTEQGLAERFAEQNAGSVYYVAPLKSWLVYEDKLGIFADNPERVRQLLLRTVRGLMHEAADPMSAKDRAAYLAAVRVFEKNTATESILAAAQKWLSIKPDRLDANPDLLNCTNVVVDLRDGSRHEHSPDYLMTKVCAAAYDPDATNTTLEKVLTESTGGDEALRAYVEAVMGYAATGHTSEEVGFFVIGETGTAKSTLWDSYMKALGSYAKELQRDAFTRRAYPSENRDSLLELEHVRVAISPEAPEGREFDTALLKAWLDGSPQNWAGKWKIAHAFNAITKVLFHCNEIAHLPHDDDAVWRRIKDIPQNHKPACPDVRVKRELLDMDKAGAAWLAVIVRGAMAWNARCAAGADGKGLQDPPAVERATRELRESMNPLAGWLGECAALDANACTKAGLVQSSYETFMGNARDKLTQAGLRAALAELGVVYDRDMHGRMYRGIRLVDGPESAYGLLFQPSEEEVQLC